MKKHIGILFLFILLASCSEKKEVKIEHKATIEDSIRKIREQEVINLDINDSKSFDSILESGNLK